MYAPLQEVFRRSGLGPDRVFRSANAVDDPAELASFVEQLLNQVPLEERCNVSDLELGGKAMGPGFSRRSDGVTSNCNGRSDCLRGRPAGRLGKADRWRQTS